MCSVPRPRWAARQGLGVKIITGDRDLLQLVNERTVVYLAGDDQNYITPEDVLGKLHVRPEQVVDYKALVGDKSDNIPGVAGVGEKTTENLLAKYGTLDNIYAHLDEIEPRWRNKLESRKRIRLHELTTRRHPHRPAGDDRPGTGAHRSIRAGQGGGPLPRAGIPHIDRKTEENDRHSRRGSHRDAANESFQ